MHKLAIMGSGKGSNFEAIVKWFKNQSAGKDVEITCLSDVENAPILTRAEKLEIKHQFLPFDQNFEYFSENHFDLVVLAGYMQISFSNSANCQKYSDKNILIQKTEHCIARM